MEENVHTMKVVARKTGLSPHVIRAWERRYGAVTPTRTKTNRRLYGDEEIKRLRLLAVLTEAGYSIGQIAGLGNTELLEMATLERSLDTAPAAPLISSTDSLDRVALQRAETAVEQLNSDQLKTILTHTSLSLGHTSFIDQILVPLVHRLGEGWRRGDLGIANEHMASAVIRTFMGKMLDDIAVDHKVPHLLATTPSGQVHEFGALMAALTAAVSGWRTTYLGPNLPASEIVSSARTFGSRIVLLSVVYPLDDPGLEAEFTRIKDGLPDEVIIIAGGSGVSGYSEDLARTGVQVLESLADLRRLLASFPQLY